MVRVKCIKCGEDGNLTTKQTKTRGRTYLYYYVQHYLKGNRNKWCYLGSYDKLPVEYKKVLSSIDINTQNIDKMENLDSRRFSEIY